MNYFEKVLLGKVRNQRTLYSFNEGVNKMAKDKENKAPVDKFRIGTVCLSKWENESDDETFNTFSVKFSYFDKKAKEFVDTSSISVNQLMNLKVCIDNALGELVVRK